MDGSRLLKALVWTWAAPGTLLGLVLLVMARVTGGEVRRHAGTLEVHGGAIGRILQVIGFGRIVDAIALGHVVAARDAVSLEACRGHEHVHVRQWERWGPLFLPAYFGASLWALLQGRDPYLANVFEREARAADGTAPPRTAGS
jgi:hypothetical protein